MQLSIIIVNYNVKYFLEQCLCSIENACRQIEVEIFVVDNNSTDGSRDFFSDRFNQVNFIWNSENTGFSKANNLALKEATGNYILFLNPDTILTEDCLKESLAFIQKQDAGALGIRMIDGSGNFLKESKRAFPSPFTSLFKLTGLAALFPSSKLFARYYLGHLDQYTSHEIDVIAGAFMLIKKKVLDKTGGFDERFFLYGEDVDLSYRIQKAGFKNFYFAGSAIIHFKGESTKKDSLEYVRLFYGAMILFVKKHYSGGLAGLYNLLIRIAVWVKAIFSGIGYQLRGLLIGKIEWPYGEKCIVISDQLTFPFIQLILQRRNPLTEVVKQINPDQMIEDNNAETVKRLCSLIAKEKVGEIIFCFPDCTVKEAIGVMQQMPNDISFWFYFKGTGSIIGSKYKKTSGSYVVIDKTLIK